MYKKLIFAPLLLALNACGDLGEIAPIKITVQVKPVLEPVTGATAGQVIMTPNGPQIVTQGSGQGGMAGLIQSGQK
jgi:hypothetical protein